MAIVRRKCFISYHHADEEEVRRFIDHFDHLHNSFIYRGLGLGMAEDLINSTNTDYVMGKIRERYLRDSSVTIVMAGRCTWARRYVDWEIQSSLRSGATITPNGLLGLVLSSAASAPKAPDRLISNVTRDSNGHDIGYALWHHYPSSTDTLVTLIESAFQRRATHRNRISNPRERMVNNRTC